MKKTATWLRSIEWVDNGQQWIFKDEEVKVELMSSILSARIQRSMKNLRIVDVPSYIQNYILPDRRQNRYCSGIFVW
jgi:hypothetical protein